jgi:hypothetical protein
MGQARAHGWPRRPNRRLADLTGQCSVDSTIDVRAGKPGAVGLQQADRQTGYGDCEAISCWSSRVSASGSTPRSRRRVSTHAWYCRSASSRRPSSA